MLKIEKAKEFKSKSLGNNVKSIRKKANLTQEQFSEKLGITPQFLSCVERGTAGISINTAINICNIAKSSPNRLFKDIVNVNNTIDKYDFLSDDNKKIIDKMIEFMLGNDK